MTSCLSLRRSTRIRLIFLLSFFFSGEPRHKFIYSKQSQQWVAKPIYEPTQQTSRHDLVERVLRRTRPLLSQSLCPNEHHITEDCCTTCSCSQACERGATSSALLKISPTLMLKAHMFLFCIFFYID